MNHRVREDSSSGHFTVATAAGTRAITFHDPEVGPNRAPGRNSALIMAAEFGPPL